MRVVEVSRRNAKKTNKILRTLLYTIDGKPYQEVVPGIRKDHESYTDAYKAVALIIGHRRFSLKTKKELYI